jgi:hypothetical protein
MTATGWNRADAVEWATLPGPVTRWLMIRRFRKELRTW